MPERPTMSYKQLFLLILTIWSAELFTRLLFDAMIPPQMEYRTVYMEKDAKKGLFLGPVVASVTNGPNVSTSRKTCGPIVHCGRMTTKD